MSERETVVVDTRATADVAQLVRFEAALRRIFDLARQIRAVPLRLGAGDRDPGPGLGPASPGGGGGGPAPSAGGGPSPGAGAGRRRRGPTAMDYTRQDFREYVEQPFRRNVEQPGLRGISYGLGGSVEGFLLGSAETYMQLDTVMARIGRRFQDVGRDAAMFGHALGFGRAQSSQMADTLGGLTNTVSRGQFQRYAGFARDRGLDPAQAMRILGGLEQIKGRGIPDAFLAQLTGRAQTRGMGAGRLGEYLEGFQRFAQQQFQTTGASSLGTAAALYDLPGKVFGANDPRGQGQMGAQFLEGLQGTLTGSPQMQNFLMRSMGFGQEGGPGYIAMRKRLEAGINDPQNLLDLFGEFQARGLNEGAQFRAIESVAGGKLKAWQIEALVKHMGTGTGMDELRAAVGRGGGDQYVEAMLSSLPESERGALREGGGGFAALGRGAGRIGMGEANALQIEDMKMSTGGYVAESLMDMREIIKDIAQTWVKIMGSNPLETMTRLTNAGTEASEALKALPWEQIGEIVNQIPWDAIGTQIGKGFTWWLNDARQQMQNLTTLGRLVGGSPP